MCTLTLLRAPWADGPVSPADLGWRVVFNRDEQRSRPPGRPPVAQTYGAARSVHPVDADGGGTWIAASASGLVYALLNASRPAGPLAHERSRQSRGLIIPRLLESMAVSPAGVPIDCIDPRRYRPFHLVIAGDRDVLDIASDGRRLRVFAPDDGPRLIRTSSGWQPRRVRSWRTRLFDALVPHASMAAQTAFHRQPSSVPGLGVEMARADAMTVSVTTIEAWTDRFRMTYRAVDPPNRAADEIVLPRD